MSSDDNGEPGDAQDDSAEATPPTRKPWLRLLFVAGLAVAAIPMLKTASSDRELIIRIDDRQDVEHVEVTWLDGNEVLWRASQRAPIRDLRRNVRLPAGRYRVDARITRHGTASDVSRHIDIAEDASSVTVPLR